MLSRQDRETLRNAGFLPYEIREIHKAKAPDGSHQQTNIYEDVWQDMIASRRTWVMRLRNEGWSNYEISQQILKFYRKKDASPWDFLQAEYGRDKTRRLTDFQAALQRRKRARITKKLGHGYGKKNI